MCATIYRLNKNRPYMNPEKVRNLRKKAEMDIEGEKLLSAGENASGDNMNHAMGTDRMVLTRECTRGC